MRHIIRIAVLLCLPGQYVAIAQEPTESMRNVTTTEIPDKFRWPAAERGNSFRINSVLFTRGSEGVTIQFRRGSGSGDSFSAVGPVRTMTINLHDTCPRGNCMTFTLNGVRKRFQSRGDARTLRSITKQVFSDYSEVLLNYFQPDRMVVLP